MVSAFSPPSLQEMGWFDDERNTTGALTTRLAEDAAHVQGVSTHTIQAVLFISLFFQATGSRLGTMLESLFGLVPGIILAFVYSWVMTFVIIGFVPLFALAGILEYATVQANTVRSKKAMLEAGKVRFVVSLRLHWLMSVSTEFLVCQQSFMCLVLNPCAWVCAHAHTHTHTHTHSHV